MHFFITDIQTEQLKYQLLRTLKKYTNKIKVNQSHYMPGVAQSVPGS